MMIASYTAAYKILSILGREARIVSSPFSPTPEWVASYHLPQSTTGNQIVGISVEDILLGQKCALMAINNPFEVTNMNGK